MADTENDIPLNIWAEAVNSLFSDDLPESLFTLSEAEIAAVSRLHPHRWPSTGRACIKWDLTVQGRAFTFPPPSLRVLQPASHTAFTTDSLVLGRAAFSDFDPLLHPFFRQASDTLWSTLDPRKLACAILHIAKGHLSPPGIYAYTKKAGFTGGTGLTVMKS